MLHHSINNIAGQQMPNWLGLRESFELSLKGDLPCLILIL